jgi:hypothetical protein
MDGYHIDEIVPRPLLVDDVSGDNAQGPKVS